MYDVPPMEEHPRKALLSMEREMTGVYITGHPLDEAADLLRSGFTTVADVREMAEGEEHGADYDGAQVSMAGILTLCKGKITKKGAMMGILSLEDLTGQIEGLVFPKVYERYVPLLNVDSLVILDGKLSFREEEEPKLLVDAVRPLDGSTAAQRMAEPLKMASARTEPRRDVRPGAGACPRGSARSDRRAACQARRTKALCACAQPRGNGGHQGRMRLAPRRCARVCKAQG